MLQMTVTGTVKNYFVVWTPHGMIIAQIYFDNEVFNEKQISKILCAFFKVFFQWEESYFYLGTLLFRIKIFEA